MRSTTTLRRTRLGCGTAAVALLTGLLATSASGATTEVEATDAKAFEPPRIITTVGQQVHWFGTPGSAEEHSVLQDQGLFTSGIPTTGLDFTRTFSAGTYAYHCEKHGAVMSGEVRVAPGIARKPRGLPFTVRWASARSDTGNRFRVQYRVNNGRWRVWQRNTRARALVFGNRSRPVRVIRGKRYSFRASSGTGTVKSRMSPVRTFRAR